jgi:hypothetical protein
MTKEEAKELCIKKWEYIVENDGDDSRLIMDMPELNNLVNQCAYCELYIGDRVNERLFCKECPLNINENQRFYCGCNTDGHPFMKWNNEPNKETAQAVLDLIKNS